MNRFNFIAFILVWTAINLPAHAFSQSTVRRAALLDFTKPNPVSRTDERVFKDRMLLDFQSMTLPRQAEPQRLSDHRPKFVAQTASSRRVPPWMGSRRAATTFPMSTIGLPVIADCAPRPYANSRLLGRTAEERRRILYPLVQRAACEAGLPAGLMDAMLIQESRYNPMALSPKGAFGLGQLMPGTAKQLGVDRYSLLGNLRGAARYLSWQLREFGRVDLALAAYNAGPGRVRAVRRIPRITETQNYVSKVLANWRVIESSHSQSQPALTTHPPARAIWIADFRHSAGRGGNK
jgi:soluble lytic murein transglycosylase-like protein